MAKRKKSGSKKEQFMKKKASKSKIPWAFGGAAIALAIFAIAGFVFSPKGGGNSSAEGRQKVANTQTYSQEIGMTEISSEVENGKLAVDLGDITKNQMVGFTYEGSQVDLGVGEKADMPLVAFVDNNGNLAVSVALCEPCKSIKFHIEEDNTLTCNTCGTKWNINDLAPVSGSCAQYAPDALSYTISGGKVIVDEAELKSWTARI